MSFNQLDEVEGVENEQYSGPRTNPCGTSHNRRVMSDRRKPPTNSILLSLFVIIDPPGKPGRPEVVDYDKDRAEIKWTAPKNDGGSPILKYVVQKREKGGDWEKVSISIMIINYSLLLFLRLVSYDVKNRYCSAVTL